MSCLPQGLAAQARPAPVVLAGRLLRVHDADTTVLGRQMVVAHRVSDRGQGPIDSMRTDAAGRFRFTIVRPESGAVYVVSSRWQGIGYFSDPVAASAAANGPLVLAVFDTSVAGPPLALGIRHVVVTRAAGTGRRVLDIFQVTNSGGSTRVGRDSLATVWSVRLPPGVSSPQAGESDIPASAIHFAPDRVDVAAPFPPGARQVVVTYDLATDAKRLTIPVEQATERFEVLVEDSLATASEPLRPDDPITIEGRTFRRYTADNVAAGVTLTVTFGRTPGSGSRRLTWLAVVGAALALGGGGYLAARRRPSVPTPAAPGAAAAPGSALAAESTARLVAQVAALDERFAGRERETPPDQWRTYQQRRAALKDELARRVAKT